MKINQINTRKNMRKRAQTMMEYLILVSVIGVGSVVALTKFGNVFRAKVASASNAMTRSADSSDDTAKQKAVDEAALGAADEVIKRDMDNFADGAK